MNKNLVLGLLLATTAPVLAEEAAPVVEAPEAPKKQVEADETTRAIEVAPEAPAQEALK